MCARIFGAWILREYGDVQQVRIADFWHNIRRDNSLEDKDMKGCQFKNCLDAVQDLLTCFDIT